MYESIFDTTNVEPIETLEPIEVLTTEEIVTPKVNEEVTAKPIVEKKTDKLFMIQIMLIIAWAILTAIIYFFGYSLFEPFINV